MKKNQNLQSAKIENQEIENQDSLNLKSLLEGIEIKEKKSSREGGYLYLYPNNSKEWINSLEGKNFRNKRRNSLRRIMNNLFWGIQSDSPKLIDSSKEEFLKEYSSFYSINDFSLSSIAGGKKDEKELKEIERFLQIIQKLNAK